MLPLPYAEVIPGAALLTLTAAFLAAETVIAVRSRQRAGQSGSDSADVRSKMVTISAIALLGVGAFLVAALFPAAGIADSSVLRRIVFTTGAVLTTLGIIVRQWSIRELGHFFTLDVRVVDNQQVVDSGPYRVLSHPSYTGAIATYLGLGLMLGNYVSILLLMLPTPLYIKRIRVEERHLLDELGAPYRRYLQGRRRLIPGVW